MTSRQAGDTARGFDPGRSFTDESLPAPNPSELPSWLQNFAEMTSDGQSAPPVAPAPSQDQNAQVDTEPDDSMMPGWLDSASPAPQQPAPSALTDASSIGGADFFSEDDLPDWLRSLSTPSANTTTPADPDSTSSHYPATASSHGDSPGIATGGYAPAATLAVPSVARVWMTDQDMPDRSAAANVFAQVAEVVDLRPDVLVSEAPSSASTLTSQKVVPAPVTAVETAAASRTSWNWTFRLVVLMVIVLAVIMLVYMNLAG